MKNINKFCIFSLLILSCAYSGHSLANIKEIFKWKDVKYENLPLPDYSQVGPFRYHIPENNNIAQMGYHPWSGLMVVTVTRTRPGVPITVGAFCVDKLKAETSPKIWAFPDVETNTLQASDFDEIAIINSSRHEKLIEGFSSNQSYFENYQRHRVHSLYKPFFYHSNEKPHVRIIAAYTANVDEQCNRLFILDTGVLRFYGYKTFVVQKPAILVYDLPANGCVSREFNLIRRAEFPDRIAKEEPSGNLYMTIDFPSNKCDEIFIYITNVLADFVAVYDYKKDEYWFFNDNPTFRPIIAESFLSDGDFQFQLPLGVVSVALGYPDKHGDRVAYYMPSTSSGMYEVSTRVLKDKKKSNKNHSQDDFKLIGFRGCQSQTSKIAVDYTYGVVFFMEFQANRVRCWNMKKPFSQDNMDLIYQSPTELYGMMIFVDSDGYLWFNKCRIGLIFASDAPLDLKEVNTAIYKVKVSDAIRGTKCEG